MKRIDQAGGLGRVALAVVGCACCLVFGCREEASDAIAPAPPIWPTGRLVDVAVPAADLVIVLASDGRLYTSRDVGESWTLAPRPAVGALRGVVMASRERGWAFGSGVVLRTEDGGRRWRRQRLPGRAADLDLRALGVVDGERAILVGANGLRLRTLDGGALWQRASLEPIVPAEPAPTLAAIDCTGGPSGRCVSIDREIRLSADAGGSWQVIEPADAIAVEPIDFAFGRVELSEEAALRLAAAVLARPRQAEIRWRVEAGVSAAELDRIGEESDPSALFALIEARAEEVRLALEAQGVPPSRIETRAPPPWDYVDRVDDDPSVLARYWADRTKLGARARVRTRERVAVRALAVSPTDRAIAVAAAGRGLRSERIDQRWQPIGIDVPYDLRDVAWVAGRAIAVGQQGGVWRSDADLEKWTRQDILAAEGLFETLLAVDFDPDGLVGFAVGEQGRLLRSLDGAEEWELLVPPAQGDQRSVR